MERKEGMGVEKRENGRRIRKKKKVIKREKRRELQDRKRKKISDEREEREKKREKSCGVKIYMFVMNKSLISCRV